MFNRLMDNPDYMTVTSSKYRGLKSVLRNVFSFELPFALFLFAWAFKADPRFSWFPMDLTEFLFILSVSSGILLFLGKKRGFYRKGATVVLFGVLFIIYALLSLAWTKGSIYAGQKAFYLSTLTLWALIASASIIASDKLRLIRFIRFLLIISVWIAIESTLSYIGGSNDVINALNSNYLALGYALGLGCLISAAYGILSGQSVVKRLGMLVMSFYFMFLLLVLGGRGPLISVAFSLIIPLLFGSKLAKFHLNIRKYRIFLSVLFLVLILVSVYLYVKHSPTATLYRLLLFFEPSLGSSGGTRISYYLTVEKLWPLNPLFGYGIGSWPILDGLPDANAYPHNLILEILIELGLVGLIFFGIALFFALKGYRKTNNRAIYLGSVLLMMFVNTLIGAMFSGDINDNRILFAMIGLLAYEGNNYETKGMSSDIGTSGQ